MGDDQQSLLAALEAHGQRFLQSFAENPRKRKRKVPRSPSPRASSEEDEWTGIHSSALAPEGEGSQPSSDDDEHALNAGPSRLAPSPEVVVFSESAGSKDALLKRQRTAFMSSKAAKITGMDIESNVRDPAELPNDDDKTNKRNDILLHELIQTRLLSGSTEFSRHERPSEKQKALHARALELAGAAKLGRGVQVIQKTENKRAIKRIREGMEKKDAIVKAKELEEAKNVGNYHPSLKKMFDSDTAKPRRKRERGLAMGVGKFGGGTLRLSRGDIAQVTGSTSSKRKKR